MKVERPVEEQRGQARLPDLELNQIELLILHREAFKPGYQLNEMISQVRKVGSPPLLLVNSLRGGVDS